MESTGLYHPIPELADPPLRDGPLLDRYRALLGMPTLGWASRCHDLRAVGSGGQGVVFLAQRQGADGFSFPVALKVFSPESYRNTAAYDQDMRRVAAVAARVAGIQHENLVHVYDFTAHAGVRVMGMEWVDGLDLKELLTADTLDRSREQLTPAHWRYVNDVILTAGPTQPRLKPGVAIQVLRDCLGGLAALHRENITHGDLKPSNVMLKRTGIAKLVDIGSAVDMRLAGGRRVWSPLYAAPEVLDGGPVSPQADLASLGYVLVEMLSGRPAFEGVTGFSPLREAKRTLEHRLDEVLPADVARDELLMGLCKRLVAAEPAKRFPDAHAADLGRKGAAAFHRHLVKKDLASEYGNDLGVGWEGWGEMCSHPCGAAPPWGSPRND